MEKLNTEEDDFLEGYYDIPSEEQRSKMSFLSLAELLQNSKPGTAGYIVIENALLKHEKSAQKNNTSYGAKIGGIFSLFGILLGALLSYSISNTSASIAVTCEVKSEQIQPEIKAVLSEAIPKIEKEPMTNKSKEQSEVIGKEEASPNKSLQSNGS